MKLSFFKQKYKDDNWYLKRPIAHRGLHNGREIPENSLAAVSEAIKINRPFEIDVHLTDFGAMVVFHDDDLTRMCGENISLNRLRESDLKDKFLFQTKCTIPSLKEVLDLVSGQVPVLIEVKTNSFLPDISKRLAKELEGYPNIEKNIAIQSFNPIMLGHFSRIMPQVPRGLLAGSASVYGLPQWQAIFFEHLFLYNIARPNFVAYEVESLTNLTPWLLKKIDIPLIVWTVRSTQQWNRCKDLCDNIIFEDFIPK